MPSAATTPSAVRWSGLTAAGRRWAIHSRTRASGVAKMKCLLRGEQCRALHRRERLRYHTEVLREGLALRGPARVIRATQDRRGVDRRGDDRSERRFEQLAPMLRHLERAARS